MKLLSHVGLGFTNLGTLFGIRCFKMFQGSSRVAFDSPSPSSLSGEYKFSRVVHGERAVDPLHYGSPISFSYARCMEGGPSASLRVSALQSGSIITHHRLRRRPQSLRVQVTSFLCRSSCTRRTKSAGRTPTRRSPGRGDLQIRAVAERIRKVLEAVYRGRSRGQIPV